MTEKPPQEKIRARLTNDQQHIQLVDAGDQVFLTMDIQTAKYIGDAIYFAIAQRRNNEN